MLVKFSVLNPKGPYLSLEKENFCVLLTYSIKQAREIMKFHAAVVQQRLRNIQKAWCTCKVVFCQSKPIVFFCCSPSPLQKLPIVVIEKFCYHGNMTSHFSLFKKRQRAIYLENITWPNALGQRRVRAKSLFLNSSVVNWFWLGCQLPVLACPEYSLF